MLEKLTKAFGFDPKPAYDASFEPENISVIDTNYFKAGARFQHTQDMNLLLPLLAEMAEALEIAKGMISSEFCSHGISAHTKDGKPTPYECGNHETCYANFIYAALAKLNAAIGEEKL